MKAFVFMIAVVMAGTFMALATPASAEILIQDRATVSGDLHQYYIGLHRPDGSCETVQVYADSVGSAMKVARQNRCISCTAEDLTAIFKSGNPWMNTQMVNYCPLW